MVDVKEIIFWIRKNIFKKDILIILLLLGAFSLTRLINLNKFPIFTDEGIYIRWAKVAWHDATWRFISLTDGRQPLQTWATIPFLKLFPNNALFAGRLFAVFSGLLSLSGLFTASYYLFGKRTAYLTTALYIFTPYFLFHDRVALVDSTVNAGVIWMFLLSTLLARTRRLDFSLLLGIVGGMSLLAKSSAKLFLGLSFLSVLYTIFEHKKDRLNKLISFVVLYCISGVVAFTIYNIQRLSPFFHYVKEKNTTFVLTFHEILKNPFQVLPTNLKLLPYYVFSEMAYVVPLIGLLGLFILIRRKRIEGFYIGLWLLASYLVISLVAEVLYPRYVMSLGLLLLLPAGYLISKLSRKKLWTAILAVIASVIFFNYTILFNPASIPFPEVDRGQYLEGWPAGWGIKEIMEYSRNRSNEKKVTILAEGNFGMSGDVLDAHLRPGDTNIEIKGYWPLDLSVVLENLKLLDKQTVLIVFSHREEFPPDWPIKKIAEYKKPGNKSTIYLYELYK
ncbi:hypothetical protein A2690_04190 [Candidatus Roizmanbacteria bacterium RIFCSPHIGHO2_01_FULL_39_12b]|uniref:Glycosyltransferase RgtA/B/C/D-like domain-containing protein n=1 Tax=Candidatus Roizmanbacteria bacterium RIFCSPHIGHO2_01_FULL_39_12b TaxID=1802030 RepID=A0A1F7GD49_9BACT|nr:MAG: hypothetical protein A2690_04190 [Candidatus Roizmanbacteria bacterium RIFCSPHIGHO2_01_FULL_39_12b]OGK47142.1 MAG: hypothetical protein A3B46_01915 [Candidatus Roizmanbacteria bacterium RIFCSPLOWO2_01_FULL_39_19]